MNVSCRETPATAATENAEAAAIQKPQLAYRYEFEPEELQPVLECCQEHGFAIVKGMISRNFVDELKASVLSVIDPDADLKPGETRVKHGFVECSPPLLKLFGNQRWMRLQEFLRGTDQLTVHRSAAILKNVGAPALQWHTDWHGYTTGPPQEANDILNRGESPSGSWFYLNGTHPSRGGLAVIEGSHVLNWQGPEGFEFTANRKSFYPAGSGPQMYNGMEVPGMIPIFSDPGDMIVFAARTYHGVFHHGGDEPRLSCAMGFRPNREPYPVPWPLSPAAQQLKAGLPARLRPYFEHYTGIEPSWKPEA